MNTIDLGRLCVGRINKPPFYLLLHSPFSIFVLMKFLCIGRAARFSPNSVERDEAILSSVMALLEKDAQNKVFSISEEELLAEHSLQSKAQAISEMVDCIFSMARSSEALAVLAAYEDRGVRVVNSARSLLRLNRRSLLALCRELQLPVPPHAVDGYAGLTYPLWLKRDDSTTQQAEDVCFVGNEAELQHVLMRMQDSGVRHYVSEQHVTGDLIKFYGVAGSDFFAERSGRADFFYTYSPTTENSFSKFGQERINGEARGYVFDQETFKRDAFRLAQAAGIAVFGGDAVVQSDGRYFFIDFNDWPSFAPCRTEAACAIAALSKTR